MPGSDPLPMTIAADASASDIGAIVAAVPLDELIRMAGQLALDHHGPLVTYSRKVFIPLTRLCRDVCHYCTFATTPRRAGKAYLDPD